MLLPFLRGQVHTFPSVLQPYLIPHTSPWADILASCFTNKSKAVKDKSYMLLWHFYSLADVSDFIYSPSSWYRRWCVCAPSKDPPLPWTWIPFTQRHGPRNFSFTSLLFPYLLDHFPRIYKQVYVSHLKRKKQNKTRASVASLFLVIILFSLEQNRMCLQSPVSLLAFPLKPTPVRPSPLTPVPTGQRIVLSRSFTPLCC